MNIEDIEQKITEACDKALANGWRLVVATTFREDEKCCCALGACGVNSPNYNDSLGYVNTARLFYGMSEESAIRFTYGFDNISYGAEAYPDDPYYQMGHRLYEKYKPRGRYEVG